MYIYLQNKHVINITLYKLRLIIIRYLDIRYRYNRY